MAIYGDRHIEMKELVQWAKSLSTDGLQSVDIGGSVIEITPDLKKFLDDQIKHFSSLAEMMQRCDDWRPLQGILTPLFFNAFFRVNNHAIRVANYYECIIAPSNIKTYKKLIKGFDTRKFGSVKIYNGSVLIGEIGLKSDLLWEVFYDYFINEDENGDVIHTHFRQEDYMSLQLYHVAKRSLKEIDWIVSELLLNISKEHDLDFSIVDVDPLYKLEGTAKHYTLQFHGPKFEHVPALYFNNAVCSKDVRMAYLSYYQVLEYFFVREQNYCFLREYGALSMPPVEHNKLRKMLKKYKESLNERESLKLVLKDCVDMAAFKSWLTQSTSRVNQYCTSSSYAIDLSKSDDKIIAKLGERIYAMRCSIAHAKGDIEEYIAVPSVNDSEVLAELELVKYAAYEALKKCSEI